MPEVDAKEAELEAPFAPLGPKSVNADRPHRTPPHGPELEIFFFFFLAGKGGGLCVSACHGFLGFLHPPVLPWCVVLSEAR